MTRYHCPYCPNKLQLHKKRSDGVMICVQCGDPLAKVPLIKPTQIFAVIAVASFLAPLLFGVLTSIKEINRPQLNKSISPMAHQEKQKKAIS